MCFIGFSIPEYLVAITDRGEWTISMIFEIYLGFAEPGDQYLCNSDNFPFFIHFLPSWVTTVENILPNFQILVSIF
jgi:hypothetical protein